MIKIIADSGSTKTDWCVLTDGSITHCVNTQGINPFHQSPDVIKDIITSELLPQINGITPDEIHFYGSGCNSGNAEIVKSLLSEIFKETTEISVSNDLLGAARAVCGSNKGIACIMGTGANSCLFDGKSIIANTPPLGYILGDEGSGAVLGKLFLNALYKGFLPETLRKEFEAWSGMNYQDIITRIYREPLANRFLASLAPFIHENISEPAIQNIATDNFRNFFRRNVVQYNSQQLPVGAVGSIAFYFQEQLREAASLEGYAINRILRSPMDGLLEYHASNKA